ncbi:MAG: hypothetical protein K6G90_05955 [Clostridia bacterium]|nr:hypothetical protein [Clostridia bacterium]
MKYADVPVDGNKYRAVTFSHYRPFSTISTSTDANNISKASNGYDSPDTVYWFRYEPIVWRILDADVGLMMTESIIDSQAFNNVDYESGGCYYSDEERAHYSSDWAYSSLRERMNGDFLNAAFDPGATTDKIFLLSREDALNTAFGFISGTDGIESANRTAFGTDYAKCQGLYVRSSAGEYYSGASDRLLRTPSYPCGANYVGACYYNRLADSGIRPALKIDLRSAISQSAIRIYHDCGELIPEGPATCTGDHTTGLVGVKEATATEDGYTGDLVCTTCGQTIEYGEVIPATGEKEEKPNFGPCVMCGKYHNGDAADRLIGALHSLIHRFVALREYFAAL